MSDIKKSDFEVWRDAKKYRKALVEITETVTGCLSALDRVMREPSSNERGKKVAAISNALEMQNDRIRYGVLGIDFRTDKKPTRT